MGRVIAERLGYMKNGGNVILGEQCVTQVYCLRLGVLCLSLLHNASWIIFAFVL